MATSSILGDGGGWKWGLGVARDWTVPRDIDSFKLEPTANFNKNGFFKHLSLSRNN